ncbi:hypothetical protein KAJ27_12710 [bacterium]|nr:hypothetical protein [bacterium]
MKKKMIILTVFTVLFMVLLYSNATVGLYEFLHKTEFPVMASKVERKYKNIVSLFKNVPDNFPIIKTVEKFEYLDSKDGKSLIAEIFDISLGNAKKLKNLVSDNYVYFEKLTIIELQKIQSFLVVMLKKNIKDGKYIKFFKTYLKVTRFIQELSYGDSLGNYLPFLIFSLKIENDIHDFMLDAISRDRIKPSNYRLLSKFFMRFNQLFQKFPEAIKKDSAFFIAGLAEYRKTSRIGATIQGILGRVKKQDVIDYYFRISNISEKQSYNSAFDQLRKLRDEMKHSSNLFLQRASGQPFEQIYKLEKIVSLKRRFIYLSACLKQYKNKNGEYPEKISEVKPEETLLKDPFSLAETLQYKITGTTFLIHSSGFDSNDDKGDQKKDLSTFNYKILKRETKDLNKKRAG